MYAISTKAQTASATQLGSDASSADSSSDESWVDMGKQAPVGDPKDLSNRPKRWYPFSDGPRSCVGQSLAYMNLVGTLAALLARFHFRLADQVPPHHHTCLHSCLYACLHRCYAFQPEVLLCFITHTSIHVSHVASHIQTMQFW